MSEQHQQQPTLFSPAARCPDTRAPNGAGPPVHNGAHDTEISAERRIAPIAGTLREKVLDWIHEAGDRGITMKEAGARYAVEKGKHPSDGSCRYSVAPRITELAQLGYVKDGGQRRDGCVVWVEAAPGDDPGNMMVVVRRQRAPRPLPQ